MKAILCYGDSNTNGCNPKCDIRDWVMKPEDTVPVRYTRDIRWTGVLQKILGEKYYVIEEGLPGRTFMYDDAILPYRSGKDYIRPCMMSHAPVDLLIIMLGTNDTKALFGSNEYTFMVGMEEFLKIVKDPALWDGKAAGKILLIAPPPLGDSIKKSPYYGMFDEKSVELSKKIASLYEKVAEIYGCYFLNAAWYVQSDSSDSIHFSMQDHEKLAKGVAEKIKEIFGEDE